jgi:hypothetical protein
VRSVAGNLQETAGDGRAFTVDTTPPPTTITSAPTGTITKTTASIAFDAGGEAGATFQCRVNSADFAACTSPLVLNGLAQGQHTVEVRSVDALGNADATPATASFGVDSLAPTITFLPLKAWRIDTRGRVIPRLTCADASRPCTGSITVASASKIKLPGGARKVVTFAATKYSVKTTAASPVVLSLSRTNRKLLANLGSVKVRVTITVRDNHGNTATTRKALTLRAPVARKRR